MALSPFEKLKVIKYIKETEMGSIYYRDICSVLVKERKASYEELIEFFARYIIDNLNKDNVAKNILAKCVSCVNTLIGWVENIDDILLGEVRLIGDTYNSYLERNKVQKIDGLDEQVKNLHSHLKKKYPVNNEEEIITYVKEINDLQEQIKALKRELDQQIAICSGLNKKLKERDKTVAKKCDEVRVAIDEKEKGAHEIKALKAKVNELMSNIKSLQADNLVLGEDNNRLNLLSSGLELEVNTLKERILELERILEGKEILLKVYVDKERMESLEEIKLALNEERKEKIKEIILARLTTGGVVLDELLEELIEQGFDIRMEELFVYFNEFKKEINILSNSLSSSPSPRYVIVPPSVYSGEVFNLSLSSDCKSYDILLVSDMHISTITNEVISDYNKLLNYCASNNIKLILNAGDFFCFKYPFRTDMLTGLTGSKKIVDKAISKLPMGRGIYHAVLGGNHDKDSLEYGFDAIKMLTDAREDFISLGYDHATITFNGQMNLLHSFMLHHPSSKFMDPVLEDKFDNESLIQSLDAYYSNNGRRRDDSYLDVLGHFHRSGLDSLDSICTVPSLWHDRFNNGAWHLKIYFDELSNIKYMIFKPLNMADKIVATTEIAYQKLTLK